MSERLTNGAIPGQRGANGAFLPGCKPGPGNPFAKRVAAYRKAFFAAVTDEDLEALARHLYELAMGDDMAAAKLVLQYCCGSTEAIAVQVDEDQNVILVRHHGNGVA